MPAANYREYRIESNGLLKAPIHPLLNLLKYIIAGIAGTHKRLCVPAFAWFYLCRLLVGAFFYACSAQRRVRLSSV